MAKRESEASRRAREAAGREHTGADAAADRFIVRDENRGYTVAFPNHFGVMSKGSIKLHSLELYPGIADALAHGYTLHGICVQGADTRYRLWQELKTGLLKYLEGQPLGRGITLGDVDETFLKAFKVWLDTPDVDGCTTVELTRRAKLMAFQQVLRQLMTSKRWRADLSPRLKLLDNPYPRAHRTIEHTKILDDLELEALYIAAASDCEAITAGFVEEQLRLTETIAAGVTLEDAGRDGFHCAAYMLANFKEPLPPHSTLIRATRYQRTIPADVYAQMLELLHPTLDDLLPFILLLSVMFAFNPGVVLNMTHDDYEEETLFGRSRIRLTPYKPRSHRNQVNTVLATDDPDNPRTIFRHLEARCARTRHVVKPEFANRVFLRFSRQSNRGVAVEASDLALRSAIARFCSRHEDIGPFQLRQIRPTTLDLVHEITGGNLLAMQQVANHASPETTNESYTSAAFQRRNEEMLADGMAQLERKYRTEGRVDPVERHRLRVDLGSATPGFVCADPYDSPMKGEERGRLCKAYGRCPMCELAMIDPMSDHAYAYLLKLRKALDEAAGRLGSAWVTRWMPVREKLVTRWAPLFTDTEVRKRGTQLAEFTMPDIPKLD